MNDKRPLFSLAITLPWAFLLIILVSSSCATIRELTRNEVWFIPESLGNFGKPRVFKLVQDVGLQGFTVSNTIIVNTFTMRWQDLTPSQMEENNVRVISKGTVLHFSNFRMYDRGGNWGYNVLAEILDGPFAGETVEVNLLVFVELNKEDRYFISGIRPEFLTEISRSVP